MMRGIISYRIMQNTVTKTVGIIFHPVLWYGCVPYNWSIDKEKKLTLWNLYIF